MYGQVTAAVCSKNKLLPLLLFAEMNIPGIAYHASEPDF
jgi:hypothetical protein